MLVGWRRGGLARQTLGNMFPELATTSARQPTSLRRLAFLCHRSWLGIFLGLLAGNSGGAADLARQFSEPPGAVRPWVWTHWLHGNVSTQSITRDLEAIQRAGLGGVTMFDVQQPGIPAGPNAYFSPAWQDLFAWQVTEATRLGLEVMSQNGPGYSGNGGPWITPEFASQKIVESATRVAGGARFSGKLPLPPANGGFYRDVAVLAIRETAAQADYRIEGLDLKRLVWTNYIKWVGTRSAPLDATAPPAVCIPRTNIVNLTGALGPDGSLQWDVPPGEWTILRFGHTWTGQNTLPAPPAGHGPECDKLDPRGIRAHFQHVMSRMIDLAGPAAGKNFHGFFVDSWEAGGQNWTEKMPQEFLRRRGYDLIPYLPVITGRVVGDLQMSERFLFDLRQTVSELMVQNFWAEMQRLCQARGIKLAYQPYITTGNDLDAANYSDEPMGECWAIPNGPITDYRHTIKAAASVANLNRRSVVGVEAFTSTAQEKWQSHPAKLKALGDQMFCLGGNRLQIHRFAMQRFPQLQPGLMMGGWGQQYDRTQTWWEWSKPWHDYLARCQLLLRQGPVVTDVLAVVPEEPLYRFEHQPIPGYDYDACGPDLFKRVRVTDGKVGIPGGNKYSLLTVAHHGTMTLARLQQLRELVANGANLLAEPPAATPSLENFPRADAELHALVAELWGTVAETERAYGRGRVFRGMSPAAALERLGIPVDFTSRENVSWIHRANENTDIYFIASASDQPLNVNCTFRVSGQEAELWQPETGTVRPLDTVAAGAQHRSAVVPLGPGGSAFVVFRSGKPAAANLTTIRRDGAVVFSNLATPPKTTGAGDCFEFTAATNGQRAGLFRRSGDYVLAFADGSTRKVSGVRVAASRSVDREWTLTFPPESGVGAALSLGELVSWTQLADANARHFSGTATYRTDFTLSEINSRVLLDLGRVAVMAQVRVNGVAVGTLWKAPYCVDITEAVKVGANTLEIAVVNLWVNRLIGDAALPEDAVRDRSGRLLEWPAWVLEGKASPVGRRSFVTFPLWKNGEPLQESGLLGPVTLHFPVPVSLESEKTRLARTGRPAANEVDSAP